MNIRAKIEKTKTYKKSLLEIFNAIDDVVKFLDEKYLFEFVEKYNSKTAKQKIYNIIEESIEKDKLECFEMMNDSIVDEINSIDNELIITTESVVLKELRSRRSELLNTLLLKLIEYRKECDEDE